MENKLFLLTKLYEEENIRLEALIKASLEDFEGPHYLSAHCYQKALNKVENTIRTVNKLEKINAIVPSAKSQTNAGILEKALADLISKKIKKFKIIFNKSEGVSLELSAKGQVIKIVSSTIKKNQLYSIQLPFLQKLGPGRSLVKSSINFLIEFVFKISLSLNVLKFNSSGL